MTFRACQIHALDFARTGAGAATPILMDKIRRYVDQAFETARLRRNDAHTPCELVSGEIQAELEAIRDALRYVRFPQRNCVEGNAKPRQYVIGPSARWGKSTLRISNILGREASSIRFSTAAMRTASLRLQNEWETVQAESLRWRTSTALLRLMSLRDRLQTVRRGYFADLITWSAGRFPLTDLLERPIL
jgi:hypothetical protein